MDFVASSRLHTFQLFYLVGFDRALNECLQRGGGEGGGVSVSVKGVWLKSCSALDLILR